MQTVKMINFILMCLFFACYMYQFLYIPVSWLPRKRRAREAPLHRFAVLIAARNEETVIGNLLDSIKAQSYPERFLEVFVVADNCRDKTAETARAHGAEVYERHNASLRGKGYALDFLLREMERHAHNEFDGYIVLDADNVLDVNYFREMNKTFDNGAVASTSYRNSKNYGSNWITAGYAVWFMREAKYLSQARLTLGTSCAVSGTGFFISAKIIDEMGGWKYHMLTEDIEFSTASIVRGRRISYTPTAMLYDEQPLTFRDSWNQRFRWAKGFYQVFFGYGGKLVKGIFTNPKGSRFACYDMLMTICPAMLLTIITIAFNAIIAVLGVTGVMSTGVMITSSLSSIFFCLFNFTLFMFMFGALTTFTEWDNIHAPARKKIFYMFTFPLFMITYIPIALVALVKKASWKPIQHSISVDVQEFAQANAKDADRI